MQTATCLQVMMVDCLMHQFRRVVITHIVPFSWNCFCQGLVQPWSSSSWSSSVQERRVVVVVHAHVLRVAIVVRAIVCHLHQLANMNIYKISLALPSEYSGLSVNQVCVSLSPATQIISCGVSLCVCVWSFTRTKQLPPVRE